MTHVVTSIVDPPAGISRALLAFAAGLVFQPDQVRGPVLPAEVVLARTLVHAVFDRLGNRAQYYRYQLTAAPGATVGTLVSIDDDPPLGPGFPPRPIRIPRDHVVLLAANGRLLGPPLPLPVEHVETVPLTVVTNSTDDAALLVPPAPLEPDTYTLTWAIDRARHRADTPDDDSNYRARATLDVVVPHRGA
jgi:hypothetical protein